MEIGFKPISNKEPAQNNLLCVENCMDFDEATKWVWPTQIQISDAVMRRWMKTTGRREEAPALEEMK